MIFCFILILIFSYINISILIFICVVSVYRFRLCLILQYDGSSDTYKSFLKGLNITFVVLFCFEATLKIIAYRLVS